MAKNTSGRFPDIGKFSLALIEHLTEPVLGSKAQEVLKAPAASKELRESLIRTLKFVEERFISEYSDKELCSALLNLPISNLPSINQALFDFYEHPASPILRDVIIKQLYSDYPSSVEYKIHSMVEKYLEILRQEIIGVSADIREKIDSVTLQSIQSSAYQTQMNTHEINNSVNRLAEVLQTVAQPTVVDSQVVYSSRFEREMRNWFEVLGYRFETYEYRKGRSFEWIINVTARRGYDRIFVYAIEGEAEVGDLNYVQNKVDELKTQEGWLVSALRISQATRDAIGGSEKGTIFCYTFDELLEESADFSGYFKWLENEVKNRRIDKEYIPLSCKKKELDANNDQILGTSRYDEKNGWIDGYVDRWLDDPNKEHLSILGEFGMGKTWFSLHYAWSALKNYREAKAKGVQRPRIPLVIPLRDYAKAVSIESLFSEFFFRKYEIPIPGYSAFEALNRMGKLLLIFDGFDEMASKVDRQKMINNFWELAKALVPGSKVLLTCRTEHFPVAKEGRALLGAELRASTMKLTGEPPQFEIIELEYFDENQIHQMLSYRADKKTVKQIMSDRDLMDLVRRPLMSELVLDAIPDISSGKPIDLSRIYLYAVQNKMEQDIKTERTFTSLPDKLYFLCELSWEMLSTNRMTLNYREFPETLQNLFGNILKKADHLDHWQYDMMGQTLLTRNDEGDYSPAHRSLAEFFVAYKLVAELGVLHPDFINIARSQVTLKHIDSAQNYTWSDYFKYPDEDNKTSREVRLLNNFLTEDLQRLIKSLGKEHITPVLLRFISNMLNKDLAKEQLLMIIRSTRGKSFDETGYLGANAFEILATCFPDAITGGDFSETNLQGLRISMRLDDKLSFSKTSFEKANLRGALLWGDSFEECNFANATCNDFTLTTYQYDGLSINPKNGTIALSSYRDIILLDIESKKLVARNEAKGAWHVAYSPNADFIVHSLWGGFCIRNSYDLQIVETLENSKFERSNLKLERYREPSLNLWATAFAFTPDSKYLYLGSQNSVIYLWDCVARKELGTLIGHTNGVKSLSLSGDSGLLVSCGYNELIVWDTKTNKLLSTLKWKKNNFGNAVFHPTKNIIAVVLSGKGVLLLDPYTLKSIANSINNEKVDVVKFSFDGQLITFSARAEVTVLEYPTMNLIVKFSSADFPNVTFRKKEGDFDSDVEDFIISADNEKIFVIYDQGVFAYFDMKQRMHVIVNYHFSNVVGANFTNAVGLDPDLAKYLRVLGAIA